MLADARPRRAASADDCAVSHLRAEGAVDTARQSLNLDRPEVSCVKHGGEIPTHRAAWACGQTADTEWTDTKWIEEQPHTPIEVGTGDHARCGCGRTDNSGEEYNLKAASGIGCTDAQEMVFGAGVAALGLVGSAPAEPQSASSSAVSISSSRPPASSSAFTASRCPFSALMKRQLAPLSLVSISSSRPPDSSPALEPSRQEGRDRSLMLEPSRQEGRDWSLTHQFAAVFGAFTFFGLISALPRGLALLTLSRLSPPVSMQDVLEERMGFGDMMAECKEKGQVWTELSTGGQFHKLIVTADYALAFIGSLIAYISAIQVTFPVHSWRLSPRATNSMKGFFFILAACNVVFCLHSVVDSLDLEITIALSAPRQWHKLFNWCLFAIIIVSFLLFSFLSRSTNEVLTPSKVKRLWWVIGRCRIALAIGLILIFCFYVNDVQKEVLRIAGDGVSSDRDYQFLGVLAPVVLGKVVLMVLRIETRERSSSLLTTAMMLSFLGGSFASLTARRFIYEQIDGLLINCAVIGACEIVSRGSIFWIRVLVKGKELQRLRINTLTLGGLLDLNEGIRHEIESHSGHMLIDQGSEIAVCVTIAVQYLCVPEWVTRNSRADYQNRLPRVALFTAVQLLFELVVDYVLVQVTYRGRESLVTFLELCKRTLWNKYLILFCFGIMTYHGITFWPKCTSCQKPIECLLYIECGRGQPVKIGTQDNVCLRYHGFTNNTDFELLAIHNRQRSKHRKLRSLEEKIASLRAEQRNTSDGQGQLDEEIRKLEAHREALISGSGEGADDEAVGGGWSPRVMQNLTLDDLGCLREDVQCRTLLPNVHCSHVDCRH
jgi:hypothetical protein